MPPLVLGDDEVQQLQSIASSRSLSHSIVQRAQIVLACGAGETNTAIANRMDLTGMTVGKWRKRYRALGLEGLHDELRPGRPRPYGDDTVAEVINRALQTKPADGSTQWSARSLAAATGISKPTVHRWLQTFSVQLHRQKTFQLSTDPFFVEKVRDIVGFYLNPPDKAMVLCVDEKTQIQALERTQPLLPMGLGYGEGVTHDSIRHGTNTDDFWLNQEKRWFGIITQRAIRRGSFSSVKELIAKIEQFVAAYNKSKAPFNWTATADSILEMLQRLCSQISGTPH